MPATQAQVVGSRTGSMWNPVSGAPFRRLGTALRFPFRADDYVLTLLVGVLLLEFGYLLLPAFVYMGYQVDVLRRTAMGADRPPSFGNWIGLLLDGVKAFLVGFGFLVNPATVALALLGVYLGVSVEQLLALGGEIPLEEIAGLPIAVLVGDQAVVQDVLAFVDRVLALGAIGYASVAAFGVVAYVFPAALVRFALDEEHSIDAARDLGVLAGVVRSPRYLATWLVVLGLYAVQSAAVWVPLQFSVGVDVAPRSVRVRLWQDLLYLVAYAIVFHLQLGAAYLVGRRYRELRRAGATDQPVVGLAQRARVRLARFLRERVSAVEGDAASAEAASTDETKVADPSAQTPQVVGVLASLLAIVGTLFLARRR